MTDKLHNAAHLALETLLSCCKPAGGCDDQQTIDLAVSELREALGDKRPMPYPSVADAPDRAMMRRGR